MKIKKYKLVKLVELNFMKIIFIKRLIPSLKRRLRVLFGRRLFLTKIQDSFFYLDIQDKLHRSFYYSKKYEEGNFRYIKNHPFFKKDFIFIDVGANIGIYSIFISKFFKNCTETYSFEPIPKTYNLLKKNISKNNLHKINLFNIALSDEVKVVTMSSEFRNSINQSAVYSIKDFGDIKINSNKLDNMLELNHKNIYIKCDTEGHDLNVLKGMKKHLIENICFIQVENNNNSKLLGSYLEQFNFKLININDRDYFFTNFNYT